MGQPDRHFAVARIVDITGNKRHRIAIQVGDVQLMVDRPVIIHVNLAWHLQPVYQPCEAICPDVTAVTSLSGTVDAEASTRWEAVENPAGSQ